jgi:hypothetical protein
MVQADADVSDALRQPVVILQSGYGRPQGSIDGRAFAGERRVGGRRAGNLLDTRFGRGKIVEGLADGGAFAIRLAQGFRQLVTENLEQPPEFGDDAADVGLTGSIG